MTNEEIYTTPKLSYEGSIKDNTQEKSKKRKFNEISTSSNAVVLDKKRRILDDQVDTDSTAIKASGHGIMFQLKLLMLYLLRATYHEKAGKKKYEEFRLATEMTEAEKLDDIVFQYKDNNKWKFRLVQAKHKQSDFPKKIKVADFLVNNNKADFSIQKYFYSYLKINQRSQEGSIYSVFSDSEIEDVIVVTNTDFDIEDKENILEQQNTKSDPLLETTKLPKVTPESWKFKPDTDIIKQLRIIFENNSDFYKLIESLIAHILNDKQINHEDVWKKYYYPLVNEMLQITQINNQYFVSLNEFINNKNCHGQALNEDGTKLRNALIKEMAFIKGAVTLYGLKVFGSKTLPYDEDKLKDLAKSLANLTKRGQTLQNDLYDYNLKEVININDQKFQDIFINGKETISGKVTELSPVAKKLRRILIDEFEEQNIHIEINKKKQLLKH